jgi:hypothetical protein
LTVQKVWVTYMGTDPKHVTRRVKFTDMLNWESLFALSRLSTHRSTKSSTGVNPQGRSTEKVKLLLNDSHLEPQAVRPQCHRGMTTWSNGNPNAKSKSPLPGAPNVEVDLRHFLRHRYESIPWRFVDWRDQSSRRSRCKL